MNKKGVTLVELIVSFAIVCVATIYMFRMVTSVKQIYSTVKKETNLYVEEASDIRMMDACFNKFCGESVGSIQNSCGFDEIRLINNNIYEVSKNSKSFFKYYKPYSPIIIDGYTVEEAYQEAAADVFAIARTFIKENNIIDNSTSINECNEAANNYTEFKDDEKPKGHICKVAGTENKFNIVVSSLNLEDYISSRKEIGNNEDGACNNNGPCSLIYSNRYMTVKIEKDNYCFYLSDQKYGAPSNYRFELCGNTSKVEYVTESSS